ncbi:hypothetical protein C2S52_013416 [Perilla frutescens var. hirtella]|nr:hypothetical protein C2S52_013416 [Perilla frutescens var. hirtella]
MENTVRIRCHFHSAVNAGSLSRIAHPRSVRRLAGGGQSIAASTQQCNSPSKFHRNGVHRQLDNGSSANSCRTKQSSKLNPTLNSHYLIRGGGDNETEDELLRALKNRLAPSSEMESLDAAYILYCEYAPHVGFSVRKGSQGYFTKSDDIRMKLYHCACEGQTDNKSSLQHVPAYKKQQRRTDCKARLRVVWEHIEAPWKVSVFKKEHNHELYAPDQTYLLRSVRNMSHAQKSILEQLNVAGIGVSRACRFMEREANGVQNVSFTRKDAYNYMNGTRRETRLPNGDATALMQFLVHKGNTEPFFYWDVMLDDDGRLMNFFFRDSRSALDYEIFGDVLTVDTTFKTNKYNLVCTPFVGINHHRNNIMFGMGFLSDETTQSFEWLFATFIASMQGREPVVIFSDQCQALINGIDYCFQQARHHLCQWHISQNAPAYFGPLQKNKEFRKMWRHCMHGCEIEYEFELTWRSMIERHGLQDHTWFDTMYSLRSRWADVFTNQYFSAGMHATSRSERNRERAEDAFCLGIPGQYVERNRLLTHATKVYTRNVYKIFEKEAVDNINVYLIDSPVDYMVDELEFTVGDIEERNRPRCILFNQRTEVVSCTCRMWEMEGVLCRHILKVFFTINLRRLPDGCILKRWTRHARNRSPNSILTPPSGDLMDDMLFVNSVMRLTYALALECNESAEDRASVHKQPGHTAETIRSFASKRTGEHRAPSQCGSEWSPYGAFGSTLATNTNNGGYENESSHAASISGDGMYTKKFFISSATVLIKVVQPGCANTGLIWTVWSRVELAGHTDVTLYLRVTARTLSICTSILYKYHRLIYQPPCCALRDKTMSGTEPLSQNSSFYSSSWTQAVEKIVLQKLRLARWSRDWEPRGNSTANQTVLRCIVDEINTVEASEMTWTTIAKEDPRYLIDKEGPEREWELMKSIFAPVIQISSSADSDRSQIQISSGRSTSHSPIQIVSSTWSGFGQASSTTSDVVDQWSHCLIQDRKSSDLAVHNQHFIASDVFHPISINTAGWVLGICIPRCCSSCISHFICQSITCFIMYSGLRNVDQLKSTSDIVERITKRHSQTCAY